MSGIFSAQSGTPIDFTADGATLGAPGNTQRPNLNGDPTVFGTIGPRPAGSTDVGLLYFDTSVFSAPAANTFGNMRATIRSAGPATSTSTGR